MGKKIFVTVGTTQFDHLINTVISDEILKEFNSRGYNELIMQIGNSKLEPDCTLRFGFKRIEYFKFKQSLIDLIKNSDLVISHAGAGSCLEALELEKKLIVVINESLMDNHQLELAEELEKCGFLYYCKSFDLLAMLKTMKLEKLKKFQYNTIFKIVDSIDEIMGFR